MPQVSRVYGVRECKNCTLEFEAQRPNMVYCGEECRKEFINARLLRAYHDSKIPKSANRTCASCDAKLSRYNNDSRCHVCQQKEESMNRKALLAEMGIKYIDEELSD